MVELIQLYLTCHPHEQKASEGRLCRKPKVKAEYKKPSQRNGTTPPKTAINGEILQNGKLLATSVARKDSMPESVNKRLLLVRNEARITYGWGEWMVDQKSR